MKIWGHITILLFLWALFAGSMFIISHDLRGYRDDLDEYRKVLDEYRYELERARAQRILPRPIPGLKDG